MDWTKKEVDLIVADYFSMLVDELNGKEINKSLHRQRLKYVLNKRSDGSIEYKHQNISAVLIKLSLPFIKGYKPKWNYQQILEENIIEYLTNQKTIIEQRLVEFTDTIKEKPHQIINFEKLIETPPERQYLLQEPSIEYERRPIKVNYLQKEQMNLSIGRRGEELIYQYEQWRLKKIGNEKYAEKVEWVSQFDDSAGFDILSRNENGTDRYIEVKTTRLSKETPIFFSKNEYEFSIKKTNYFHLYRLFNFLEKPRMFTCTGSFDEFCTKEPVQYKGYF